MADSAIRQDSVLKKLDVLQEELQRSISQAQRMAKKVCGLVAENRWVPVEDPTKILQGLEEARTHIRSSQHLVSAAWQRMDKKVVEVHMGPLARRHPYDAYYEGDKSDRYEPLCE